MVSLEGTLKGRKSKINNPASKQRKTKSELYQGRDVYFERICKVSQIVFVFLDYYSVAAN